MNRDLTAYRKSYEKSFLEEENLPDSPFKLFSEWFAEVEEAGGVDEANAMTITTTGLDGFPKARIVLLKHFDEDGFVFYTNYSSEKGKAIAANNKVCISFFWPNLERQVIIKGTAQKIEEQESTRYFLSRPRGSQLGALASDQSEVIKSREALEKRLQSLEKEYKDTDIPKPKFWGGYCIAPIEFEFWQGRANRLHDRIRYANQKKNWQIERLSP
ncbi:pyridoxamine 5'-phosphate oxidase [Aquimarina sp. EL_43]|uniref:pyridoxamine 5'-phosphate oxidase n=1 Tax=unclassified Aquimarina TaxID=2627091 RepID=UPI0018CB39A4|nr:MULTISPECIES: pyridoxamine 5'-phosphate oxidase [unclassified Aquimarina]MBG6129735.1 pyridoxamine 5'-phosphate oxidase [Aquimarina sp. EL_35]MBG6150800.1 pyridoxamine 5'-phosphate oxidase [Aquimarina sp. EL_32]MBG6167893.1 pyridoxamine 5'-phosphate oxidase [Aquimarina sp. EL_43]